MDMKPYLDNKDEKPLDRIVTDGGMCSVFRKIACIGDSLSSGEFEATKDDGNTAYVDLFEYSWGQFIARMAGSTVYNFSRGGMTAKAYLDSFASENGMWDKEKACQAYIIALGVNDLFSWPREMGSVNDICLEDYTKNADTFAGAYGAIIQRYKEISPDSKFFLMSMCRDSDAKNERNETVAKHAALLYDMANLFTNTYVIDLYKYGPDYNNEFKNVFYMSGHMNPLGYRFTAEMVASYIDYIVRHNFDDFRQVGFIGTPFVNKNYKK